MTEKYKEKMQKYYCELGSKMEPYKEMPMDVNLPYDIPRHHIKPVPYRVFLNQEQYMDFLATPKGYRWNKRTGLAEPFQWTMENLPCYQDKRLLENDNPLLITDQRFINTFFTEIWNYLTPDMLERLKLILQTDLRMTELQAEKFLHEQKIRSTFGYEIAITRKMFSKRHQWVKRVSGMISRKVLDYILMMFEAQRTVRVKCLARTLARKLGELTGEEVDISQDPGDMNTFQAGELLVADRLALWLAGLFENEVDNTICREEFFGELEGDEDDAATGPKQTPPQGPAPP